MRSRRTPGRPSDDRHDVVELQLRNILERQGESEAVLGELVRFQAAIANYGTDRFGDIGFLRRLLTEFEQLLDRIFVRAIAIGGTEHTSQVDVIFQSQALGLDLDTVAAAVGEAAALHRATGANVVAVPGHSLTARVELLEPIAGGAPPAIVMIGPSDELELPYEYVQTGQRTLVRALADGLTRWGEFIDISSKLQATKTMTSIAADVTQSRRDIDFFDLRTAVTMEGPVASMQSIVPQLTAFLTELRTGWNLEAIHLYGRLDDMPTLIASVGEPIADSFEQDLRQSPGTRVDEPTGADRRAMSIPFDLHARPGWGSVTYVWSTRAKGGDDIFLRHFTNELGTLIDSFVATSRLQRESFIDRATGHPNENAMYEAISVLHGQGAEGILVMFGLVSLTKYLENYDTSTIAALQRRILGGLEERLGTKRSIVGVLAPSILYAVIDRANLAQTDLDVSVEDLVALAGQPQELSNHLIRPAVAAGCSHLDERTEPAQAVQNCYAALGDAAHIGSGAIRWASAQLLDERRIRYELEREIEQALANGEFVPYFQPEFSLINDEIMSFESLVRWNHPTRGVLGPGAFIPIAEENDLVVHIDLQNLEHSVRQFVAWGLGNTGPKLRVNLSSTTMHHPMLAERILAICADSGMSFEQLCVEVTETSVMRDEELGIVHLRELRRHGVGVALDDFGIGTSSLARLRSLPITVVKMDRAFVMPLPGDEGDRAFVAAIASMAHAVGLDITAEGVETEEQRDVLVELGFHKAQGFLFAAPLKAADVEVLLGRGSGRAG